MAALGAEVLNGSEHLFTDVWFLIPNWKWMAVATAYALGWVIDRLFRWIFNIVRKQVERRFSTREMAGLLFQRPIHRPLARILAAVTIHASLQEIQLPGLLEKVFIFPIKLWGGYNGVVLCYLGVDAVGQLLEIMAHRTENSLDDHLAPMATKVMKVFVIVFGTLIVLQSFGVPVMSVLAGLGLGGLALALAAQDTAANLFGSVMIILDRPFQTGDWIKVADVEGKVEEVGLRSTRLRTAATSVITVPNAMMAKEKIDNIGARRSRRSQHFIALDPSTTVGNVQLFMEKMRGFMQQHPKILKDDAFVTFTQFADSGLKILITFYMQVNSQAEEYQTQEDILFEVIRLTTEMKIGFATTTQNLNIKSLPDAPKNLGPQGATSVNL